MRVLIEIEYDGTNYCGWQRQKNGLSVQAVLADALSRITGECITLHGSGRTDAGVHALGQCAHFDTDTKIPVVKIPFAVNTLLPRSIRVYSAREVTARFNARFDAEAKTYVYKMYSSPHSSPTREKGYAHIVETLNVNNMRLAAEHIIGTHDFKCFQAAGSYVKDTVRTIQSLDIGANGNDVVIEITGSGFLYNMVRIIAGTLFYVGIGKLQASDIPAIIDSKDRKSAGKTMPPCGLYLKKVYYKF